MFQFRRFPAYAYLIQRTLTEYCSAGFPHSEICGSTLICSSPQLIAACHVLLRLLMPRHSPCALISLTLQNSLAVLKIMNYAVITEVQFWLIVLPISYQNSFLAVPAIKVPQHCCLLPSVACFALLSIYIVQFSRCRASGLFQGQIETLNPLSASIRY